MGSGGSEVGGSVETKGSGGSEVGGSVETKGSGSAVGSLVEVIDTYVMIKK